MNPKNPAGRPFAVAALALLCAVLGLALATGGVALLRLGGSAYHLVLGLAWLAVAALLWRGRSLALAVLAALLAGAALWSWKEVGPDFWALGPRLGWWWLIGCVLALPRFERAWVPLGAGSATGSRWLLVAVLAILALAGAATALMRPHDRPGRMELGTIEPIEEVAGGSWPSYGGPPSGTRYSPLSQITPSNASQLQEAWHFRTGDLPGPGDPAEFTVETTPIKVGDRLYLCTPHSRAIALDATTGALRWRYDPVLQSPVGFKHFEHMTCRGVSYFHDPSVAAGQPCAAKVFLPTADARLIALDAQTGKPCEDFGQHGQLNLLQGIPPFQPGGYYSTSPPAVAGGLVIVGSHVSDNVNTREPPGVVRAFDARTGRLAWAWDSGRPDRPGEAGREGPYEIASPNMWSVPSVDEKLGLVYLPMGNQTPDQWGAGRTEAAERVSAGIVALDLRTGTMRWSRQFTHHDLWDMDVGGQPSLVDIDTPSGPRPALVASTKQGSVYVLDRRDGTPLVGIAERPVPQGAVPGDRTSPTQPVSALNFNPPPLREADMWGVTPFDELWCRVAFRSLRYEGPFTPPSTQGSLVYPGNFGVFDWGGLSVDPIRQVAVANPSYMAFVSRLIPRQAQRSADGHQHGEANGVKRVEGAPYDIELRPFLSPLGVPCQRPPWGYVAGVDLKSARIAWMHKNGTVRDSSPVPLPFPVGVPSLGGTIVTAGGVAFLSGSLDQYVRAYSVADGRVLWEHRLPAGGQATPMSYGDSRGRQLVVVVAGGHGSLGTRAGDHVIAFALRQGS